MNFQITVVVISHNHYKYIEKCLDSVINSLPKKKEIIFIENLYYSKTVEIVKRKFPRVKYFINKKPKGFSENCNYGLKKAEGKYVLILNPDVIVKKDAIEKLYKFMLRKQNAVICGPKLLNPDMSLQYSARRFPNVLTFIVRRTPLRYLLKNSSVNKKHLNYEMDHSKEQKVDWLLGSALFLEKDFIQKIGGFDERFFLYVEDIDICMRIWQNNKEVWYVPKSIMIHYHLALSDRSFFSIYSFYHFKSIIYFFFKHSLYPLFKKFSKSYVCPH